MGEEALEMMVVLRMNRKLMKYMRSKYSGLKKEQFGISLIKIMDGDQKMPSS